MGGLLMSHNMQDLTVLGGMRSQEASVKERVKKGLERDWGIETRNDALETLGWLTNEGHRQELVELCALADRGVAPGMAGDEDIDRKLRFVERHRDRFLRTGLLAWDANRLVVLAGWAAFVGLISETEAWSFIVAMAFAVQQTYGSWEEYGIHHLLGFEYWSGKWDGAFARNYRKLLDDPNSPWRAIPWQTDLRYHGLQTPPPTAGYHVPPPRAQVPSSMVNATHDAHAQGLAQVQASGSKTWLVSLLMMLAIGAYVAYTLWDNGVF